MTADLSAGRARASLRSATATAHERLHHMPAFGALQAGTIGHGAYVALLQRMFGFHRAVEERLSAGPSLGPLGVDIAARRRAVLLLDDLACLGATPGPQQAVPGLPVIDSPARGLGCLYVVEGSTLGGRMLAARLDHLLGPDNADGRRFLLGHGARHGAMWQAFCAALEQGGDTGVRRDEMAGAALATFAAFAAWFGDGETLAAA